MIAPKLSVEQFFKYYSGSVEIVSEDSGHIWFKGDTFNVHNMETVWLYYDVKYSTVVITQTVTKKSISYEATLRIYV